MSRIAIRRLAVRTVLLSAAAIAVVTGCGPGIAAPSEATDPDPSVTGLTRTVGDTATLELGEAVRFEPEGVVVSFLRLVSDSRCPPQVTCVWEGDAEVRVLVAAGAEGVEHALHTTLEPRSVAVGALLLELVDVYPLPSIDPLADPATPRILIRLARP